MPKTTVLERRPVHTKTIARLSEKMMKSMEKMLKEGATEFDVAAAHKIPHRTWMNLKAYGKADRLKGLTGDYVSFVEMIEAAYLYNCQAAEEVMYKRATKWAYPKTVKTIMDGSGNIERVEETVTPVPPSESALRFYLSHKDRENWGEKVEHVHEITTMDNKVPATREVAFDEWRKVNGLEAEAVVVEEEEV